MGIADSNRRGQRKSPKPRAKSLRNGKTSSKEKPLVFTIQSDFAAVRDVQKQILDNVASRGFNEDTTWAIKLALEEAIMNAIKHGNKLDPKKKVHIEARVTPKQAEIMVEDEGPGFERCCVPDPTLEENLEKCSGRGILLMEAYMNAVKWDRGGRRVRMIKKNES